jgi:hypothetical protein
MSFELANNYNNKHLIVQPSDLALSPPESYLYIQDFLIISCGVLYALCYMFYMTQTYADRVCAGDIRYTALTMAYELYYAIATTSTRFERRCFLVWFFMDATFATVTIFSVYPSGRRSSVVVPIVIGVPAGLAFLSTLCRHFPDGREQVTAYWTGILLQLPVGWGSVYLLIQRNDTKGQSLEIWCVMALLLSRSCANLIRITRCIGCLTAYGVFVWRYLNVPQNWGYVGSWLSITIIVVTLIPEVIYPAVYAWACLRESENRESAKAKLQ